LWTIPSAHGPAFGFALSTTIPENYEPSFSNKPATHASKDRNEFLLKPFLNEDLKWCSFRPKKPFAPAETTLSFLPASLMAQRLTPWGSSWKPGKKDFRLPHPGQPFYVICLIPKNLKPVGHPLKKAAKPIG